MKKILTLFVLLFMLVACSSNGNINNVENNNEETEIVDVKSATVYEFLEGDKTIVTRNNEDKDAYIGMRLITDDVISTDEVSKTYLRIDDCKNILLDTETKMSLSNYSKNSLKMELLEGAFFFDVTRKLDKDEEMSFKVSNTTMSIRGTSGSASLKDNKAKLYIFTGEGYLTSKLENNEEVHYSLYPLTKMEFEINDNGEIKEDTISIEIVDREEIPENLQIYAHENEKYIQELKDDHWEDVTVDTILPPDKSQFNPMEMSGDYIGWKQLKDGSWYFEKDNYDEHKDPEPYVEEVKPAMATPVIEEVIVDDSNDDDDYYEDPTPEAPRYPSKFAYNDDLTKTYTGSPITVNVNQFDANTMNISGNEMTDVGKYRLVITPKEMWSDGTTDPIVVPWTIEKAQYKVEVNDVTLEYDTVSDFVFSENYLKTNTKPFDGAPELLLNYNVKNQGNILETTNGLRPGQYDLVVSLSDDMGSDFDKNFDVQITNGKLTVNFALASPTGTLSDGVVTINNYSSECCYYAIITTSEIPDDTDMYNVNNYSCYKFPTNGQLNVQNLGNITCGEYNIYLYAEKADANGAIYPAINSGTKKMSNKLIINHIDANNDNVCDKCGKQITDSSITS